MDYSIFHSCFLRTHLFAFLYICLRQLISICIYLYWFTSMYTFSRSLISLHTGLHWFVPFYTYLHPFT